MKKIITVGYPHSTQFAYQIRCLREQGAHVICLEPELQEQDQNHIIWSDQSIYWNGEDISPSNVDAVLVNSQATEFPQEDSFLTQQNNSLNWENWFRHYCLQRDRSDTLLGLLLNYEAHGIPFFNPPSKSNLSRRKPYQISQLKRLGCPMPETLITNNPEEAKAFLERYQDVILKPAAGGALTLDAGQLSDEQFKEIKHAPAIFQRRIRGGDVRVMVINHKVVSSVVIDVPDNTLDFRGDQNYQSGGASYTEVPLPKPMQTLCEAVTKTLGLRIAGIDLKMISETEMYFLECNSSPIYLDVERKIRHPITQAICDAILK